MSTQLSAPRSQVQADRTDRSTTQPTLLRVLFRIFWVVLLVFLAGLIFVSYREWQAAEQVSKLVEKIRTEERALASTADEPDVTVVNSPEANAWIELIRLSQDTMTGISYLKKLPFIGEDSRRVFAPKETWEEEPFVAETLEFLRPIIEQLEVAVNYPLPDFYPTYSTGSWFRYSNFNLVKEIGGILQLEIAHAIYHQDHPRALRAFGILARMFHQAGDQADLGVLVNSGLLLAITVLESLESADWTADDLQTLESLLPPEIDVRQTIFQAASDYRRHLVNSLINLSDEKAVASQGILFQTLRHLPTFQLAALETANKMVLESQHPSLLSTYRLKAMNLENQQAKRQGLLAPSLDPGGFWNYSVPLIIGSEDYRNLTRTALAIKRFQLVEGAWPRKLADLKSVGLTESDYTEMSGQQFGFEVGPLTTAEREFLDLPISTEDLPMLTEDLPDARDDLPNAREDLPNARKDLPNAREDEREYAWLWMRTNPYSAQAVPVDRKHRPHLHEDRQTHGCVFRIR